MGSVRNAEGKSVPRLLSSISRSMCPKMWGRVYNMIDDPYPNGMPVEPTIYLPARRSGLGVLRTFHLVIGVERKHFVLERWATYIQEKLGALAVPHANVNEFEVLRADISLAFLRHEATRLKVGVVNQSHRTVIATED